MGSDPKFTAPVVCVDAFNPVLATGWRQEIRGQLKFTAPVVCVDAFNPAHAGLCQVGPCQVALPQVFALSALPRRASPPKRCSDFGVGSQLRSHSLTTHSSAKSNWAQTPISRASTPASSKAIAASAYSTGSAGQFLSDNCAKHRPHCLLADSSPW